YRVAMNVCLDRAKKHDSTPADLGELPDERPDPSAEVHAADVARHVSAALATLPDSQRTAVTLCLYQGLRHAEAAAAMDLSVQAVGSLLARPRRPVPQPLLPLAARPPPAPT